jgi:S1-C subfamily serine protease
MTAAHCIADNVQDMWGNNFQTHFTVDGLTATVIKVDHERDLAVVLVDEVKPSLEFRDEPLALYEDVNGIGFGYGLNDYLVTPNKAEILNYRISIEGKKSWPGTVFMGPFIGGMSGGPIIDKNGKVVGVVQAADSITAYGVNVATIQEFLAAK